MVQKNSSLAMTEENSPSIYMVLLDFITITILNATVFFLYKSSDDPLEMRFYFFVLPSFTLSQPSMCRLDG